MNDEYEFVIEILNSLEERLDDLTRLSMHDFRSKEEIEREKAWVRKNIEEYTKKKIELEKKQKIKTKKIK